MAGERMEDLGIGRYKSGRTMAGERMEDTVMAGLYRTPAEFLHEASKMPSSIA